MGLYITFLKLHSHLSVIWCPYSIHAPVAAVGRVHVEGTVGLNEVIYDDLRCVVCSLEPVGI